MSTLVLLAAVLALGATLGVVAERWRMRRSDDRAAPALPTGTPHVLDLLRRAHSGVVACVVAAGTDPLVSEAEPAPARALVDRVIATARLAKEDGRQHTLHNGHVVVAVGDGDLGFAAALDATTAAGGSIDAVSHDLRCLLGEFRAGRTARGVSWAGGGVPDWLAVAPHSVEGLAHALGAAARVASGRATAVALRDHPSQTTSITEVSQGGDRMLFGLTATADSAVGRACAGDVPVVGPTIIDLLGRDRVDRRTRRAGGTAFPLRDGREGIGALIVFGDHDTLSRGTVERLLALAADAGPRLARALAVHAAETRALTDVLTGLPNRRALEKAFGRWPGGPCALLCVDIDHFKKFNDGYGHIAGDAALKHVAQVFRRTLRDHDVAARIGGEEFALWLPDTTLPRALDVGERVRCRVAAAPLHWSGADLQVTCSVGVAALPDSVSRIENLFGAADAALYSAKRAGRNQVQASRPRVPTA